MAGRKRNLSHDADMPFRKRSLSNVEDMAAREISLSNDSDMATLQKEWNEALCPICMDHPHNAVLIICSSHEKGCQTFICDTSYRHSNCLDQFKRTRQENVDTLFTSNSAGNDLNSVEGQSETSMLGLDPENHNRENSSKHGGTTLQCPLCRGDVLGWKVLEDARKYLNLKSRSCSREHCSYSGNYIELRRHARKDHPMVRPTDVDPFRQREWCRLEDQREMNDILSVIQSSTSSAGLFRDSLVETAYQGYLEAVRQEGDDDVGGRLLSAIFLFHMMLCLESSTPPSSTGHGRSRHSYSAGLEAAMIEAVAEDDEPSNIGISRRRRLTFSDDYVHAQPRGFSSNWHTRPRSSRNHARRESGNPINRHTHRSSRSRARDARSNLSNNMRSWPRYSRNRFLQDHES